MESSVDEKMEASTDDDIKEDTVVDIELDYTKIFSESNVDKE